MDNSAMGKVLNALASPFLDFYNIIRLDIVSLQLNIDNNILENSYLKKINGNGVILQHVLAAVLLFLIFYVPGKVVHSILDVFFGGSSAKINNNSGSS